MNHKIYTTNYHSPVGDLLIGVVNDQLCLCDWSGRSQRSLINSRLQNGFKASFVEQETATSHRVINQLQEYFAGERTSFDVPIVWKGTTFQERVWSQLQTISYGHTITYQELSKQLNQPKAIRAVASANGANALSIIIPCHRVVGQKGALVGYAGGVSTKKQLLQLEAGSQQMKLF